MYDPFLNECAGADEFCFSHDVYCIFPLEHTISRITECSFQRAAASDYDDWEVAYHLITLRSLLVELFRLSTVIRVGAQRISFPYFAKCDVLCHCPNVFNARTTDGELSSWRTWLQRCSRLFWASEGRYKASQVCARANHGRVGLNGRSRNGSRN